MAKYTCATLGDCDRANTGEVFERSPGEDLKCPDCGILLQMQAPSTSGNNGPRGNKLLPIAAAVIGLALLGGAALLYTKRQPQPGVAETQPVAAAPALEAPASATSGGGIAPPEAETAALRRQGEASLTAGDATQAAAASNRAATNEILKLAIAKMAQGKLDEAEQDLQQARSRAPQESLVYYNFGVLRLKQNRTADALREFEASFMAGFTYFDQLDKDSDLAPLRKDPRFAELLAKYRKTGQ